MTTFKPDKCHGRQEFACVYAGSNGWVCMPSCNVDADCGSTSFCNFKSGLCQPTPPTGAKTGAVCSTWDECTGLCQWWGGGSSVCTDRCTIGAVPSCGWQGPGHVAPALCLASDGWGNLFTGMPQTAGDYGYCIQTCDTDADCQHPAFPACAPISQAPRATPDLPAQSGKEGICTKQP
jgi:hypothetical protein